MVLRMSMLIRTPPTAAECAALLARNFRVFLLSVARLSMLSLTMMMTSVAVVFEVVAVVVARLAASFHEQNGKR